MYSDNSAIFRCHVRSIKFLKSLLCIAKIQPFSLSCQFYQILKSLSCIAKIQPFSLSCQIYQILKKFVISNENPAILLSCQIYQIPKKFVMQPIFCCHVRFIKLLKSLSCIAIIQPFVVMSKLSNS